MKKKLVHIKGYISDHRGGNGYYPYLGIEKYVTEEGRVLTILKTYDGDRRNKNDFNDFGDEFDFAIECEDGNNFEIITVYTEKFKEKIKECIDNDDFDLALKYMRGYRAAELSI